MCSARTVVKGKTLYSITQLTQDDAAAAPASPVPTTMTSSFLLLLGATIGIVDLYFVHFSANVPAGIFEFKFIFIFLYLVDNENQKILWITL